MHYFYTGKWKTGNGSQQKGDIITTPPPSPTWQNITRKIGGKFIQDLKGKKLQR
jgi:hypothetical protein